VRNRIEIDGGEIDRVVDLVIEYYAIHYREHLHINMSTRR